MFKQTLAIIGSLIIAGTGVAAAQRSGPAKARNEVQKRTEVRNEFGYRFVDENGDGICDLYRDHDSDGIPNRQDPDWNPPRDGSGYQGRTGRTSIGGGVGAGLRNGLRAGGGANAFQRDDDGDGVPNGQDPDWKRPMDGSGYKSRFGAASFRSVQGVAPGLGLGRGAFTRNRGIVRPGVCTGRGPGRVARRTN